MEVLDDFVTEALMDIFFFDTFTFMFSGDSRNIDGTVRRTSHLVSEFSVISLKLFSYRKLSYLIIN